MKKNSRVAEVVEVEEYFGEGPCARYWFGIYLTPYFGLLGPCARYKMGVNLIEMDPYFGLLCFYFTRISVIEKELGEAVEYQIISLTYILLVLCCWTFTWILLDADTRDAFGTLWRSLTQASLLRSSPYSPSPLSSFQQFACNQMINIWKIPIFSEHFWKSRSSPYSPSPLSWSLHFACIVSIKWQDNGKLWK